MGTTDKEKIRRITEIIARWENSSWQYAEIHINTVRAIRKVIEDGNDD